MATTPEPPAARGGFIPSLNGIRAIAIILVFFVHVYGFIPPDNLPGLIFQAYSQVGWIGVDLFFVLSGFLITGILLNTLKAKNYFRGFYARRALRIFPLYYTVLTVIILLGIASKSEDIQSVLPLPQDRWVYYCYLTNWVGLWKAVWGPGYCNYLAHFWSLGVEEQFYFFWPLTVWLLPRRFVIWAAALLAVFAACFRLVWMAHAGPSIAISLATITRMDSLFLGAIVACIYRDEKLLEKTRRWLPIIASVVLGGCFLVYTGMVFFQSTAARLIYGPYAPGHSLDEEVTLLMQMGGFTVMAIGFAAVVLMAALKNETPSRLQRFLSMRGLDRIGRYSYGIYVYHVPLFGASMAFVYPRVSEGGSPTLVGIAMIVALAAVTFGVAALSYEFFEKPLLNLKRYFEPEYTEAGVATARVPSREAENGVAQT